MSLKDYTSALEKKKLDFSMLNDEASPCNVVGWLSTGNAVLDWLMGGGLPMGRVVEIYGEPSTGKSLIAAQLAAYAQQQGGVVAYADTETAVSRDMMANLGVDIDKLIYASPDTVEEVFTLFDTLAETKAKEDPDGILLLIWDSVAATSARFEMEAEYGKATVGRHAGLISQGLRKFTRVIARERICLLLLNQTRQAIGVMFGDDVTTFGGKAVSFHASIRVQLDAGAKIKVLAKHGKRVVGAITRAVTVKNKTAPPFREAKLPIYFGRGLDDAGSLWYWLDDQELLTTSGSFRHLILNGVDHAVQRKGWRDFHDAHYDDLMALVEAQMAEEAYEPGAAEEA